jgi:hypothetical protein
MPIVVEAFGAKKVVCITRKSVNVGLIPNTKLVRHVNMVNLLRIQMAWNMNLKI